MLIFECRKFIQDTFKSEEELENVVAKNSEYLFGPSSIYFPRTLIKTMDGISTIPDGFVIDLASRQWYIVEAELSSHNIYTHIYPQVAKQINAAQSTNTRKRIAKFIVETVKNNKDSLEKFQDEGIEMINIHQVISDILEKPPIIGMPIDNISNDLKVWASTLKSEVKLWIIKKYIEFGVPTNVMYELPEEYRPAFDTVVDDSDQVEKITQYDVKLIDLVEAEYLFLGEKLYMSYKPTNGTKQNYEATIQEDGSLIVLDKAFTSPSYAALYCIQTAGSNRTTTNGWENWKNKSGQSLAFLRDKYLTSKEKIKNSQ